MGPVDSASWRDDASRHYRWEAFDLIAAGHHELGVVAAQVHLEAQLRFALRRAGAEAGLADAELPLDAVGRPTQAAARRALQALLGVDLARASLVEPLERHLARVADVLDGAARVTCDEAHASLEAIDALWAEIARAASPQASVGRSGADGLLEP